MFECALKRFKNTVFTQFSDWRVESISDLTRIK